MARLMIMRSKNDNKSWLVNLDEQTVSEIESEAFADETSCAFDADKSVVVEVRAHAASHGWFTT
jgi:hypothetical protein